MTEENAIAAGSGGPDGFDYDVVVIGSGFGGSVAALRLTEKGYRVGVLEAGRRFTRETLPKNSWDVRNYLWAPALGLYGIQRIHLLNNVLVLAGAGVGGGSLNYANTLYVPPKAFFDDRQWGHITDWADELAPFYDQAKRMLGVRTNPTMTPSDLHLKAAADGMGYGDTFHLAPVGVFFGDADDAAGDRVTTPGGEVPDPYFGGAGPARRACVQCGECMTGCRHGAKNTLTENYLHLAESAGAEVRAMTTVVGLTEHPQGGYRIATVPTDRRRKARPTVLRAGQVVVAAGTYGTQTLLHAVRDRGELPRISDRLGMLTRTNSESLVGAQTTDRRYRAAHGAARADFTQGVAITSSVHPNDHTHIEPVRYGKGSNAMGALSVLQVPHGGRGPRWLSYLANSVKHPSLTARSLSNRKWSERTIIGLVMQTSDNSLTTYRKQKGLGKGLLTARQGHGAPNPTYLPEGAEAAKAVAAQINGFAGSSIGEIVDTPMTAHFLGGCPIAADPEHGVIDPYQRLFGHPGVHVVDGSSVSANLGVNPSLTITAQAERAMSLWPNKGDADPRPAQGAAYVRLAPIAPRHPVVPPDAFAALLLPVPALPPRARPAARTEPESESAAEPEVESEPEPEAEPRG
ncbi:GMC family oxidoreductase [Streptomyces sp. SL13]|uniref:Cholesterol oxidase n=1 Tax=Streptantibioticus silvisoli TaxID=2705255 RepID=A0AA90H7P9_9ACTN|nr:GMC family oxidoreductase [Streptantibioticus silvisoli]MDI5972751.1 GMC family oxidoreductase [Streptantibioticus silvisoli]